MTNAGSEFDRAGWEQNRAVLPSWQRALPAAAIIIPTVIAYVATLTFGFIYDDRYLILGNNSLRSWHFFPGYFTSHLWSFTFPHLLSNAYRPLLLLWLRLNYLLFGLRPWGYHLSLVAAHVGVTCLVYHLSLRLTRDTWSAVAGALVFGLHPVHVETIAEAAWADQPLSTLLVLATLLAWWRSHEPGRKVAWLAGSLALCAAALLAKESSLVLPLLVSGLAALYSLADGGEEPFVEGSAPGLLERASSALGAAIPFWAVVLLYVWVRLRALQYFAQVLTPLSWAKESLTIPSVLFFYLRHLVWPLGLSCFYDTPYVTTPNWPDFLMPATVLAGGAALLAIWYGSTRRSAPALAQAMAFAFLWMVLTLLPVLNFRFLVEGEIAHDRYLYLPSVGFCILVGIAVRQAMNVLPGGFRRPAWVLPGALALVLALGYATLRQSLYWSDDLSLNTHAREIAPHNVLASINLAAALGERGKADQALALYMRVLTVQPQAWLANLNVGHFYYQHGDYLQAARYFVRACASNPSDGDQFAYLGMALARLGRPSEGEEAVRTALLIQPQGRNYHLALGMVLRAQGKLFAAKQEIETELANDPRNAQAQAWLAAVEQQIAAPKLPSNPPPEAGPWGIK